MFPLVPVMYHVIMRAAQFDNAMTASLGPVVSLSSGWNDRGRRFDPRRRLSMSRWITDLARRRCQILAERRPGLFDESRNFVLRYPRVTRTRPSVAAAMIRIWKPQKIDGG